MFVRTARLGPVETLELPEEARLTFPAGLPGFEDYTAFALIEDACESLGAEYRGRPLGAHGPSAVQEASVIAASLVAQAISFGFQALLGIVCLKSRVGRALQASAKEQAAVGAAEPVAPAGAT